jgi:hypothetical protein
MYEDYYAAQNGRGGMPVFAGSRGQRGHGLGSMLSGLFRSAMPMIKQGLSAFGKQALRTGAQVVSDWADGGNIGESFKQRSRQGIKELVAPLADSEQTGSGRRRFSRKRAITKKNKKNIKRRRKKYSDIFA